MDEHPLSWLEELPHTLDIPTYVASPKVIANANAKKDLHQAVQVIKQAVDMLNNGEPAWRVTHVLNAYLNKNGGNDD